MDKFTSTIPIIEDDPNDRFFIAKAFHKVAPQASLHQLENGLQAIAYLMGEGDYSDRRRFP